ncbi:MAG: Gfo/Idh/MocA family oxidoreductase [Bacteroidota bacterium]
MSKSFRWGILGLGKIAHKFAQALATIEEAELVAVGSRSEDRAQQFAQEYGARLFFGTYAGLIQSGEIDAVYIATPHVGHHDLTVACLEAGVPVLCEKPLGMNLREVESMIATAERTGTYLMEALWTRFLSSTLKVLELIEVGEIGQLESLRADFGFKLGPNSGQRISDPALGGGNLLDIGIYPVFLSQLLFGPPSEIQAMARLGDTGVDIDTSVNLRFADGRMAQLYSTLLGRTKTEATLLGQDAILHWHSRWHEPSSFSILRDEEPPQNYFFEYDNNGYAYEARAVMEDVAAGRKENSWWSLEESRQLHQTLTTIRQQIGLHYPGE